MKDTNTICVNSTPCLRVAVNGILRGGGSPGGGPLSGNSVREPEVERMLREQEAASLATMIARLEAEATWSVSRCEPDTAHGRHSDYDGICEAIISLKRRLNALKTAPLPAPAYSPCVRWI